MTKRFKSNCPHCNAGLKVDMKLVGKAVKCPKCKESFQVGSVRSSSGPSLDQADSVESVVEDSSLASVPGSARKATQAEPTRKTLGRLELRKVLGEGGFGRVYRAYDPQLDRFVALKVPKFGLEQESRVRRFLGEAKAAARLRHPNIVPTFDSGCADGNLFIATQFIEGRTLAQVTRDGCVDERQAAQWARAIAEALAYAHLKNIIHRDIKPQNILLDNRNQPQVMDFGLAKRLDEDSTETSDGSILGTPAYMAPEQARGDVKRIGPASDQYAVGAVFYELLTGTKPFEGSPHAVIGKVVSQEPPAPRTVNESISKDLEAICQKAMSKEIDQRYPDCQAVADDLDRWLRGEAIAARPITVFEKTVRWGRRNPWLSGTIGLAASLLVVSAGLSISFAIYQTRAAEDLREEQGKTEEALAIARERQKEAEQERNTAIQNLATNIKDRALSHLANDEYSEGMLRMVESLELAEESGADDLAVFLRRNLAAWGSQMMPLKRAIKHFTTKQAVGGRVVVDEQVRVARYSPDGKTIWTGTADGMLHRWNADTGESIGEPIPAGASDQGRMAQVDTIVFSPDGETVFVGAQPRGRLRNQESGKSWGNTIEFDVTPDFLDAAVFRFIKGVRTHCVRFGVVVAPTKSSMCQNANQ